MIIMIMITLTALLVFLVFYLSDPRRIINGFLFNIFFCSLLFLCGYIGFSADSYLLRMIALIPFMILIIFISSFGLLVLTFGLFVNGSILMKRESRRLANSLTFILGLFLLMLVFIRLLDAKHLLPDFIEPLYGAADWIMIYFFLHLINFLTAYLLYQFNKPKYNQDFLIVLGSGLIDDKVPPLLASRVDKAIEFYQKQTAAAFPPVILFSGGQGKDENLPEAEAMQIYATSKGVPLEHTLLESRSVNTLQNMRYSKKIMDERKNGEYNSIFVTNNFHLFRASLYARMTGLNSQGIGSKTAFYYWLNAMIREYIAIVVLQRKRHFIVVGILLGGYALLYFVQYLVV